MKKYVAIPAAVLARNLTDEEIRSLGYALQDMTEEDIAAHAGES